MRADGSSRKRVVSRLKKIRQLDPQYRHGRILCSMCTQPHPIAERAYRLFLNSNLGDPGLFPGSAQIEQEVVGDLAMLLHGRGCIGQVVSGGTEANLMAFLAAKNMSRLVAPEVVLPESAHFSFTKICSLLSLKPIYAGLDSSCRVDPAQVEKCVGENTVAIVGTAGTSELGVIDPIEELSRIASLHKVWLHVDAAFGGLIIPFLAEPTPKFDFALDGVESMTVDPHKMGLAAIPAGGILFRHEKGLNCLKTKTPYLTDQCQYTFLGTRSGAGAASAWAVFQLLGTEGYRKIVAKCMKNTRLLYNGLKDMGLILVVDPTLNIVAFRTKDDTKWLAEQLWRREWYVSYVPRYDCIRIVLMPHVKRRHVLDFLKDLAEIEKL